MKMVQFKAEINEIVNLSCYLTLLSLGLYWILTGDALNKYFLKRTNFAEFSEPMDRIPTILTWIDPIDGYRHWNYDIGKDYNITLASEGYIKPLNLTVGRNMVPEIPLQLNIEKVFDGHFLKIAPLGYSPKFPTHYELQYTFKNSSKATKVSILLASENHWLDFDEKYPVSKNFSNSAGMK